MLEEAQPGQPLKAADVRRLARTVRRSTPGRSADGDAAPGSLTQLGTGAASSTSDHGKTFFVQITGLGPVVDGRRSYTFKEVGIRFNSSETLQTVQIDDGGIQADAQTPAFPVDPQQTFATGDYATARRSRRSIYCWELAPAVDGGTYVLAMTSTADGDGRFTSRVDSYDPDTDTWTTSKADILAEPAVGVTMQQGLRYPARPTTDPEVFTTTADANEIFVSSVPVYFGGLNNTLMQTFKGIKEHRSETVWRRGKDEYAYIQNGAYPGTGSDANPNRNFQAKSLWVGKAGSSTEVGDYSSSANINVGGTQFSHGFLVETQANSVTWARAQCDVYQGFDTQAGYARTIVSNGSGGIASLYALGKHGFIQLGATGSLYSSAGGPGVWTGLITVDEGTYNIQRGTVLVGIDKVYDPTTHGQIIAGGIVVDTWELSKGAPTSPPAAGAPSPPEPPAEQIISYDCVDGVCVYVEGTGGAYATLAECMESSGCNPAGFYCTGAGCLYSSIYFGGGGDFGPYDTPEECEAACPPPPKAWYQVCPIGGVGSAVCEYLTEDEATARGITAGPFETETACDEAFPAICSG